MTFSKQNLASYCIEILLCESHVYKKKRALIFLLLNYLTYFLACKSHSI